MHFDLGFKHSARLLTCTLLLMLLAGCSLGAAKYVDVSGEPDNQKLMSSRWTTNDDLLFLGIDSYPGKRRIVSFRLVPPPGFDGPEVLSRSVLPSGTQLTVIGARRCTNCWGETTDELMVTVDGFAREQPIYIRKYFLNYLTPVLASEVGRERLDTHDDELPKGTLR